jgi:membrane-associated protein
VLSALDVLHPDLTGLTAGAIYAVVFGLVFVESGIVIGFWLPGDTVLFAAGLLAADSGRQVSVTLLAVGAAAAAFSGDAVGYLTGRRLGRPWLERRRARFGESLARAEALSARWGPSALVAARFIPWVRTFTPILAGVTRMRYAAFATANLVGAVVWGSGLVLLGFVSHALPLLNRA